MDGWWYNIAMRHLTEDHKAKIRAKLLGHKSFGGTFKKGHKFIKGGEKGWLKGGNKNPNWKGDNVSYDGLHDWVEYHKGKPRKCEKCGKLGEKYYDWANISHQYKRDLDDWMRLCRKCHKQYDMRFKKYATIYSTPART